MTESLGHESCAAEMARAWDDIAERSAGELGLGPPRGRVIVSSIRVVAPGLSESCMVCPHGTTYWIAPDAEMQQWLMSEARGRSSG